MSVRNLLFKSKLLCVRNPVRNACNFEGRNGTLLSSCKLSRHIPSTQLQFSSLASKSQDTKPRKLHSGRKYIDGVCSGFTSVVCKRHCAHASKEHLDNKSYIFTTSDSVKDIICKDMLVTFDFVSEEEEEMLHKEVEPHLKRLRYETAHWDDVNSCACSITFDVRISFALSREIHVNTRSLLGLVHSKKRESKHTNDIKGFRAGKIE